MQEEIPHHTQEASFPVEKSVNPSTAKPDNEPVTNIPDTTSIAPVVIKKQIVQHETVVIRDTIIIQE